ncbi:hypothetical protein HDU85_002695 [Gaertneriomyces sp. JEL0708]|nr:hypothetical protein HDU85_002695 [Gaertneriomyces sp. JEL0708]
MKEDEWDNEDEQAFEDAVSDLGKTGTVSNNPTDATGRIKLDRKEIKASMVDAEKNLFTDLKDAQELIDQFIASNIAVAVEGLRAKWCKSLYHTLGYAFICYMKSMMTFDPTDIDTAQGALKTLIEVATLFRKEQSLVSSFTGMMTRAKEGSHLKGMTPLQKHAELIYAEAHLLNAFLALVTDTSMVAFVREGLNMRSAYNVYKSCYKFCQRVYDEEGGEAGLLKNGLDEHFVSGVLFGIGAFNIVISLLPGKVLRLFELIGFSGDRDFGLSRLEIGARLRPRNRSFIQPKGKKKKYMATVQSTDEGLDVTTGGFVAPVDPTTSGGLRAILCELSLLAYHIILSAVVELSDADLPFARELLDKKLQKYPSSFIFLFLAGRMHETTGDPAGALVQYQKVFDLNLDWRQLVHLCVWESGTCNGVLHDWKKASESYSTLYTESKWSKAIYRYLQAVYVYADDPVGNLSKATPMFAEVPGSLQKIAGKHIPLEKFVSRKSRKFKLQGSRLLLPHLEILYVLNGFDIIPTSHRPTFIAEVDAAISQLETQLSGCAKDKNGDEIPPYDTFYDDVCLARFLKGVLTRELALPSSDSLVPIQHLAKQIKAHSFTSTQQQQITYSIRQLEYILLISDKIKLDHWILPFSRLELGQLYLRTGDFEKARKEFMAALNGGVAEDEAGTPRKRVSLENALHFRVHNALVKLDVLEALVAG